MFSHGRFVLGGFLAFGGAFGCSDGSSSEFVSDVVQGVACPGAATTSVAVRLDLSVVDREPSDPWEVTRETETSHFGIPLNVYEEDGTGRAVRLYFRGHPEGNWDYHAVVDEPETGSPLEVGSGRLQFDDAGTLTAVEVWSPFLPTVGARLSGVPVVLDFGASVSDPTATTRRGTERRTARVLFDGNPSFLAESCEEVPDFDSASGARLGEDDVGFALPGYLGAWCPPRPTSRVEIWGKLDATEAPPTLPFAPNDAAGTSNFSTTITVFDRSGLAHSLDVYFVRETEERWRYHLLVEGDEVTPARPGPYVVGSGELVFDPSTGTLREGFERSTFLVPFSADVEAQPIELRFGIPTVDLGPHWGVRGFFLRPEYEEISMQNQDGAPVAHAPSLDDCGYVFD